jgi:hypothetical protein
LDLLHDLRPALERNAQDQLRAETAAVAALAGDVELGVRLATATADAAWHNHPGRFTSPGLERALAAAGRRHVPPMPVLTAPRRRAGPWPRSVLHVITEAHGVGGHTRLAWRWMRLDPGRSHSLVLTGQPRNVPVPPRLLEAVEASGGQVVNLSAPAPALERAAALRRIASGHDAAVMHVHPFDVLPALAFAAPGPDRPPVVWVNHVDQGFWLGTAVADLVLNVRGSVLDLARRRRGIDATRLILVPTPLEALHRTAPVAEMKRRSGLSEDATVLLTVAHPYKYAPVAGADFVELVEPLLDAHPDAVLLAVGPSPDERWSAASARHGGRIRALGYRQEITDLYCSADLYLDSFPFCSGGGMVEAGLLGVPAAAYTPFPAEAAVVATDLPGESDRWIVKAAEAESFRGGVDELLADRAGREERGRAFGAALAAAHLAPGWAAEAAGVWERLSELPPATEPEGDGDGTFDLLDALLQHVHSAAGRTEPIERTLARHQLTPDDLTSNQLNPPSGRHEPRPSDPPAGPARPGLRSLAFFLPQFHPIPENDAWWGAGFTEWRNVAKARPAFPDHPQPVLPGELGFYDLRLAQTRAAQAELARRHGIDGFVWYHYWFSGKRLLHQPFDEVLASGEPDLPFALCWANEAWRARWDGRTGEVIQAQEYSAEDDRAHIRWLLPALADRRAIRVDGRPLFLVYRAADLPDPARTTDCWREEALRAGVGELCLLRVESLDGDLSDPRPLGFDGAVEFAPDWRVLRSPDKELLPRLVHDYETTQNRMLAKPAPPWTRYPGVCPGWDNTPRRPDDGLILRGAQPELYRRWVAEAARRALDAAAARGGSDALVFVNAWNEWAEGAHLEPDEILGRANLEAHRRGVEDALRRSGAPSAGPVDAPAVSIVLAVRDDVAATLRTLEAVAANTPEEHFEVVVVDDASRDATPELLACLEGDVLVITNPVPVGESEAREQGRRVARGRRVVFLRNGEEPMPGWFDDFVPTLEASA